MKAMKLGLVVSLSALFFIACGNDATNNNGGQSANQNSSSSSVVAPPAAPAGATANANSATGPGMGSGNPPAPATNANTATATTAASRPAGNSNAGGPATQPTSNVDAAALFVANKCTGCHGTDGKGNPNMKDVPNFADAAWQKKTPDADMIRIIKDGKKPMPAYKDKLNDQEVRALIAYVRSFAK